MRNVVRHGDARHATIRLVTDSERALLEVEDDGSGLPPGGDADGPRQGHFGLALLRDLLEESGGSLELLPSPSGGALLRVEARLS